MKKFFYLATVPAVILMTVTACGNGQSGRNYADYCQTDSESRISNVPDEQLDTLSYALGADMGLSIHINLSGADFDMDRVKEGILNQIEGNPAVSSEEAEQTVSEFLRNKYQAYRMAKYRLEKSAADTGEQIDTSELPELFDEEFTRDDVSYRLGVNLGDNLKTLNAPVNLYWFFAAMDDAQGAEADTIDEVMAISQDQLRGTLTNYYQVEIPASNAELSEMWLQQIETKPDVHKTESGLLYRVDKKGGKKYASDNRDVVRVRYEGKTRTGKIFDSSYQHADEIRKMIADVDNDENMTEDQKTQRKSMLQAQLDRTEIIEFPLNRVIPGWTEGMKLVGEGGSITLWIPSNLAYGPNGHGRDIAPNEALVFHVELVEVKPYEEPKPVEPVEEPAAEETETAEEE